MGKAECWGAQLCHGPVPVPIWPPSSKVLCRGFPSGLSIAFSCRRKKKKNDSKKRSRFWLWSLAPHMSHVKQQCIKYKYTLDAKGVLNTPKFSWQSSALAGAGRGGRVVPVSGEPVTCLAKLSRGINAVQHHSTVLKSWFWFSQKSSTAMTK